MIITVKSEVTGSNCYIIEEKKKVLIVDPNDAQRIENLIETWGFCPEKILLTHEHFDHIEGVEAIRKRYQIPVLATRACSAGIQDVRRNLSSIYDLFLFYQTGRQQPRCHDAFVCDPAEDVFDEEHTFFWQGHTFLLCRLPGHSPGSCVIFMDENFLFTGDYLIRDTPVITRFYGGDASVYETKTKPYLEGLSSGLCLYPGHGQPYIYTREMR